MYQSSFNKLMTGIVLAPIATLFTSGDSALGYPGCFIAGIACIVGGIIAASLEQKDGDREQEFIRKIEGKDRVKHDMWKRNELENLKVEGVSIFWNYNCDKIIEECLKNAKVIKGKFEELDSSSKEINHELSKLFYGNIHSSEFETPILASKNWKKDYTGQLKYLAADDNRTKKYILVDADDATFYRYVILRTDIPRINEDGSYNTMAYTLEAKIDCYKDGIPSYIVERQSYYDYDFRHIYSEIPKILLEYYQEHGIEYAYIREEQR